VLTIEQTYHGEDNDAIIPAQSSFQINSRPYSKTNDNYHQRHHDAIDDEMRFDSRTGRESLEVQHLAISFQRKAERAKRGE
jgi:hypothetical protein